MDHFWKGFEKRSANWDYAKADELVKKLNASGGRAEHVKGTPGSITYKKDPKAKYNSGVIYASKNSYTIAQPKVDQGR